MDKAAPPTILIILFPFFFVGMWCLVTFLLSTIGGWRRLAEKYPAQVQPSGKRFFMQSGKFGPVSYGGCLIIHSSAEGLYLSVLLPFRFCHPPLFIPWSAVQNASIHRCLWVESVTFDVGLPNVAKLQLPKKVMKPEILLSD